MSDLTILKFKGKLMWPKFFHPDTSYEHKWTTDLLLDESELKRAKSEGLRVKHNEKYEGQFEGYDGHFIRADRPVKGRDGVEREPPIVKDGSLRDVPSDVAIGNGTDAIVRFIVKTTGKDGKEMSPAEAMKLYKGYGMFLTGSQIINLVEYNRDSDPDVDFVKEEGSYSIDDTGGFDFEKGDEPFDEKDVTMAG